MSARYTGGLVYNAPGGWSGQFNGTTSNLSLPYSANYVPGTGDFTVECWVNFSDISTNMRRLFGLGYGANGSGPVTTTWQLLYMGSEGSNQLRFYTYNGSTETYYTTSGFSPVNGQWYHVAVSRTGGNLYIFVNGIALYSAANSFNFSAISTSDPFLVGLGYYGPQSGMNGPRYFPGYISNIRFIKGTGIYSVNFTPPSGQLAAITNTQLLLCQSPTFVDNSSNAATVTNNSATVNTLNPFPTSQLPNPALGGAGNGVYTMSQYAALKAANLWPAYDPYYKNVTLNLHGNGTNAAQNNTFLDSSTNNFTITRNGNTTQGTFTPYGSNWSAYFNGSNGSKVDLSSAPLPATGAFTFECFIFPLSFASTMVVYSQYNSSFTNRWAITVNTNGTVGMGGNTLSTLTSTATLTLNAWNHFAVTRDGSGNGKVFVNGVLSNSNTGWTTTLDTVTPRISGFVNPSELCVNGYLSNIRITNTNLYTASFTVPTSPLTAVSGTTLLTLQDNRYKDNSTSSITLTPASTSIQRFNPFIPTTAYSTSVIGGSGYFDGSGDYLSVASNDAFRVDQGDWTIEGWVYITSTGSNFTLANRGVYVSVYSFYCGSSGTSLYYEAGTGGWAATGYTSSSGALVAGQWNHIAYVRSGTSLYMYSNGNRVFSQVVASVGANVTAPMWVGQYLSGAAGLNGNMTDFRFVKGTAVYTGATYTVPTSPLTAITNTSLLLSYTNAGILDNAMMNDLETVGNAQISTSVKKYGTGSMYFDGSGDYISAVTGPIYQFGSANFTIEFWFYQISRTAGEYDAIFRLNGAGTGYSADMYMTIGAGVSGYALTVSNNARNGWAVLLNPTGGLPALGAWHHMAIVRNGSTWTVYLNGNSVGTATYSGTVNTPTGPFQIGWAGTSDSYWDGYIDDFRITNGVARYTANFTPPTSQVQDQ